MVDKEAYYTDLLLCHEYVLETLGKFSLQSVNEEKKSMWFLRRAVGRMVICWCIKYPNVAFKITIMQPSTVNWQILILMFVSLMNIGATHPFPSSFACFSLIPRGTQNTNLYYTANAPILFRVRSTYCWLHRALWFTVVFSNLWGDIRGQMAISSGRTLLIIWKFPNRCQFCLYGQQLHIVFRIYV